MKKTHLFPRSFLEGRAYPPLSAFLVLTSHALGLESIIAPLLMLSVCYVLIFCDTAQPILFPLLSFTFLLSRRHSPSYPAYSDYLKKTPQLALITVMTVMLVLAAVFFFRKKRITEKALHDRSVVWIGTLIFCAALLLNGMFYKGYTVKNLLYAILLGASLVLPYALLRFGCGKELLKTLPQAVALSVVVVCLELVLLFASGGAATEGGSIIKERISLGWGIWNNIGCALVTPIPLLFLGAQNARGSRAAMYLGLASVSLLFAVLTLSRNALLFGTVAFFGSLIITSVSGRRKKLSRIVFGVSLVLMLVCAVALRSQIAVILGDFFDRGFSDNGRFALYREGIKNFAEHTVLGVGFYGFSGDYYQFASFMPRLPHNTPIAMLSAGGAVLFIAYLAYRSMTLVKLLGEPNVSKMLLMLSAMLLPMMSLLDNFFFNFYPTFMYTAALAAAQDM